MKLSFKTTTTSYFILGLCIATHAYLPIVDIPGDYRTRHTLSKFPILFHYDCEGYLSGSSECIVGELPYDALPTSVIRALNTENITPNNTEIYIAEAHFLMSSVVNYFTHLWAMSIMTKNCEVLVKTGVFEANNIQSINNEIGTNCLVEKKLIFHDGEALSPNTARFRIVDKLKDSSGMFVSVAKGKAIVVLWQLPPPIL